MSSRAAARPRCNRKMGFIDPELLVSAADAEGHTCCDCMNLLEKPRSVCREGHHLCLECACNVISRTPKCPECRADATLAGLHRNRPLEATINGLRMRCVHSAAAATPAEHEAKRQKTDAEEVVAVCTWRGTVADYRAHLDECIFEPYKCADCGEMVARRDKEPHAEVCKMECPFYGCNHKCTAVEMDVHHVNFAAAHARSTAAALKAAKEETPFKFCFSLPERALTTPPGENTQIDSPTYPIWPRRCAG